MSAPSGPARMHERVARAVLAGLPPDGPADPTETVPAYVVARIAGAPWHLRAGIDAVALLLAARAGGREVTPALLDRWAGSRLPPVATYVRLVRGLVVFAAYERTARV